MVQNCKPSIICLEDGTQLCCGILNDTEDSALITTTFPLEILRIKVSQTTEAISLRPWLTFTQLATFDIRQSKVVTITPLHSDYHDEFYKMTNHYMEFRMILWTSLIEWTMTLKNNYKTWMIKHLTS